MDNQSTMNIQNCGINQGAGGQITVENLTIINNPSLAGTSSAISKTPFRYNIPTPTRHFKGRKQTLEAVRDYFTNLPPQTDDCWERIVAIVGLGGMGKTETAYKFAADFKQKFPNVAWINAETASSALASFRGLANRLGMDLKGRQGSDLEIVQQVYCHLDQEDYGSVLFIFDNAIRLNSGEDEFGIMEYLPTDDLPNQRFPYVLITTQTHDWERRIETFQVDELTEGESLEFFRSSFQIESAECDGLFTKLHKLLDGYPLVMNLAASQIDYIPKKDSPRQLQQQIQSYIGKLEKENNKLLNLKVNQAWPTKYNKTLSNVWQLSFDRIQQEDNGREALELLQFMSFLHVPIKSETLVTMLVLSSDCPHPPVKELDFRLKELCRLLERFYTVRILEVYEDNEEEFICELGVHRLVQLVVRLQMDSNSKVLERAFLFFATNHKYKNNDLYYNVIVNKSAFEEALDRIQLSQRALPYVGILACHGIPAACKIVETRQPETKAAASFWDLYNLERGMRTLNENATQVLRDLIGLTKSEERQADRLFFGDITIALLASGFHVKLKRDDGIHTWRYFRLNKFNGIEELVAELILNVCSAQDTNFCKDYYCQKTRIETDKGLSPLTAKLSRAFIRADAPKSTLTVDVIAETWLAIFPRLRYYNADNMDEYVFLWDFWDYTYKTFNSPDASQSRIAALRTSLWVRGLAMELIQTFGFLGRNFSHLEHYYLCFSVLEIMDVCMDGMDLRDERVQQVVSSYCEMIATIEVEYTSQKYPTVIGERWEFFAVDVFSVWIKLFLMDADPPSHQLLDSLSRLKFLDWMERSPKFIDGAFPFFSHCSVPQKYLSTYFPQFTQRFSSSETEAIQTLVNVCRRLMEEISGTQDGWSTESEDKCSTESEEDSSSD